MMNMDILICFIIVILVVLMVVLSIKNGKKMVIKAEKQEKDVTEEKDVWIVSWDARFGAFYSEKNREAKAFLSYEDAKDFRANLIGAMEILKYSEEIYIRIYKHKD